jgi:predicted mannosyl-3-phosphoglycerate phosphatase (HAD superfamily)
MNTDQLKYIKSTIEQMENTRQLEILKLLKENKNVVLNENKSGVYINLTYCPKETLDKICEYIEHTKLQEDTLKVIENEKDNVKTEYFDNATTSI